MAEKDDVTLSQDSASNTADATTTTAAKDTTATTTADTTTTAKDSTATTSAASTTTTTKDDATAEPPGDWASLRTTFAKGDDKLEKRLARYSSVESALEALIAAQDKIAKGEHKAPLSENPTPEELAAYRAANGIPETPDKYELALADGLVVGEADKPLVDGFLVKAHELNLKPDGVNKVLSWYFAEQERVAQEMAQKDQEAAVETNKVLADLWGSELKTNKNIIVGMLDQAPEGVKDALMDARTAEGIPVMSHAPTLRWLADMARELNPMATIVPSSGTNSMQTLEAELARLYTLSGDHNSEYWKGPLAEKNQARYRELLSAKERLEKK